MDYKPAYITLSNLFNKVLNPEAPFSWRESRFDDNIIETFLIPDITGHFVSYKDIARMASGIRINAERISQLEEINKKFGGIPISKVALENVQQLIPELLPPGEPIPIDPDTYYEDIVLYEPRFDAILLLQKLVLEDRTFDDRNSFFLFNDEKTYQKFREVIDKIMQIFQSGLLETVYYSINSSDMAPISLGFWFSEEIEVLWKAGKVRIKNKYLECFITAKSYDNFLKIFDFHENVSDKAQNIVKIIFPNDEELRTLDIFKGNFDNINDSLAYRAFKLALICDAKEYRKTTNETLADFIFNTQDWYFEGTQKTMNMAKKAASMVRALDAAKGGTAKDLRKYNHETKQIV